MPSFRRASISRYGLAVVLTVAAVYLKVLVGPIIGEDTPFLLMMIPVILSAWYGGLGPGLLATGLAGVASAYYFLPPTDSLALSLHNWIRLLVFFGEGSIVSVWSAVRDRARAELSAANEKAREIVESITDGFVSLDSQYRFTFVNRAAESEVQFSGAEVLGRSYWEVFPQAVGAPLERDLRTAMDLRVPVQVEHRSAASGRWSDIRVYPAADGGLSVYFRDISERKRAEEQARHLAAIVESSEDAIYSKSLEGVILSWNRGAQRIFGYTAEEVVGHHVSLLMPPGCERDISANLERIRQGDALEHFETECLRKNGERFPISLTISPIRDAGGRVEAASTVARDITERRRVDAELRQWEYVFQNARWGVVLADPGGEIMQQVNAAFAEMHGYTAPELQGRPLSTVVAPEALAEVARHAALVARKGHHLFESLHLRKDGTPFPVMVDATSFKDRHGQTLLHAYYVQDIGERKRLEQKVQETQKLESLGVLAGGLAHDFNNLLTGIIGHTSILLEQLPQHDPARANLDSILRAGERAADLTRQMLAYSGKGRFVVRRLNLSELVGGMSDLIRTSISRKIRLELHLAEDLPPVEADASQMQQLVMNLVTNAAEAIGEETGIVRVITAADRLGPEAEAYSLERGSYVRLEVQDTGPGMDDATRSRIFDPFFTTKFTGRGLGLAAVSGIVRGHRGAVDVRSGPGLGTTFRVWLPAASGAAQPALPAAAPGVLADAATILVVDDEETVRQTARAVLKRYGYQVLLAENGLEALRVFRDHPEITLVLLDMTMPVMGGEEALAEMQAIRPDVRVIVSTGYDEAEAARRFSGRPVAAFLQKPYTSSRLAERVKSVLQPTSAR